MSCSWLSCVPAYFLWQCNEVFSFSKWYSWSHTPNRYVLHSLPIVHLEQLCYQTSMAQCANHICDLFSLLEEEEGLSFHRTCFIRLHLCFQKARGWAAEGVLEG